MPVFVRAVSMHDRRNFLKLILSLILVSTVASAADAGTGWHKTVAAAQAEARKNQQLILVDMFAEWCGWCHRMEREVFPSESFQKASSDLVLLRLDTEDRGEGTRYSREWGVTSLPTFVLVTPDLKVAGTIQGYSPAATFSRQVTDTVKSYRQFESLLARSGKLNPQEKVDLAAQLIGRKRLADAEKQLADVVSNKKAPASAVQSARYHQGLLQFEQGKYDASLNIVNSLLSSKVGAKVMEDAKFLRARIYIEQGNFRAALTELKSFRQAYPQSSMIAAIDRVIPQIERAVGAN